MSQYKNTEREKEMTATFPLTATVVHRGNPFKPSFTDKDGNEVVMDFLKRCVVVEFTQEIEYNNTTRVNNVPLTVYGGRSSLFNDIREGHLVEFTVELRGRKWKNDRESKDLGGIPGATMELVVLSAEVVGGDNMEDKQEYVSQPTDLFEESTYNPDDDEDTELPF